MIHKAPWMTGIVSTLWINAMPISASELPQSHPFSAEASIQEQNFAPNPGNLSMFTFVPEIMPSAPAPLIVLLHGCGQKVEDFAGDGDWFRLASERKAYLIMPATNRINNATRCFNWFQGSDNTRDRGEAASIAAMVESFRSTSGINVDSDRIWVVGFSAGAYMAAALLSSYPDLFAGGATLAGGAFGCASSLLNAYSCMKDGRIHSGLSSSQGTPDAWGDLVRHGSGYPSYWKSPKRVPRIMIWQGEADNIVASANQDALISQWTNLHQVSQQATRQTEFRGHLFRDYGPEDKPMVRAVTLKNMGHAVAIDPGTALDQGGRPGTYAQDVDLYSTHYIWLFLNRGQ